MSVTIKATTTWREKVLVNGREITPEASRKLVDHSPTGFAWGYGGSGPSQLALAILLELYGKDIALRWYQDFKWDFVAKWPQGNVEVAIDTDEWLREKSEQSWSL